MKISILQSQKIRPQTVSLVFLFDATVSPEMRVVHKKFIFRLISEKVCGTLKMVKNIKRS